jgi:hypothetical protein
LPAWNTPVDSAGGGGVEDPPPPLPPQAASRMLNAETTRPFRMCIFVGLYGARPDYPQRILHWLEV